MSRRIRIIYPGAVYHTGARGYERSYIFNSDLDKQHLLDIFGAAYKKYNVVIHAYAIMSNHYHIQKGYVFEDHYSAFVIQKGEPMKWQIQYIHMNPLRRFKSSHKNHLILRKNR